MPPVLIATLVYLLVLVLVLAAGLTAIAVRLLGTARALGEIRDALAKVEQHSRPLGPGIEQINGALSQASTGLARVAVKLTRADGALRAIIRKLRSVAA